MTVQEWLGEKQLPLDIYHGKYRHADETFDQWLDRVSGRNEAVKKLIVEKKFLFGGRILANRGLNELGHKITLSNCYVVAPPCDSIESIFECAAKLARTFSYGGGVGIDISNLAPRGARIHNAAKETSGAVSFMDLYSLITGLIGQGGRRGALMISMRCDHPDIEEFINIKKDLERVTKANISIRMTNEFMQAVEDDKDFELRYERPETGEVISKTVKAKELFRKIAESNHEMGEPGILFWDEIENYNLLNTTEDFAYAGVNPCAEEPLPAGGSCLLGSLNLAAFVKDKKFDFEDFKQAVNDAIIGLNEVLMEGLPLHPLTEQRESVNDWRQIGCGIMGLADALIKMEIRYGSSEAVEFCDKVGNIMAATAIATSAKYAENGNLYPKFSPAVFDSDFFKAHKHNEEVSVAYTNGLANSQLLTIAPTGSLSTMLGVSGGLEPIFANYYERKTESLHNKDEYYKVYTPIVEEYMKEHGLTDDSQLPEWFVTAQTLDYRERIVMQAAMQRHIDASISSTVNVPEDFTVEQVMDLYMTAWKEKLKGITMFRANCNRAAILSTTPKKDVVEEKQKFDHIVPVSRKTLGVTHGNTYYKKSACGGIYLTVNRDDEGNIVEMFVSTSKGGICQANIGAVNRMVSVALRSGVKVEEIADQLKGITCQACARMIAKGEKLDGISCADIIGKTLLEFAECDCGSCAGCKGKSSTKSIVVKPSLGTGKAKCPECGADVAFEGGCMRCLECAWQKCE